MRKEPSATVKTECANLEDGGEDEWHQTEEISLEIKAGDDF